MDAVEKGIELMPFQAYIMGAQPFYGKGPHPLLWAGSRVARGKITIRGIPNRLYYCVFLYYVHNFIWKVLKCGAGEEWRRSIGPIV
jgi:hypothetical protein